MNSLKLSIITPSYNQGNFIEETIRSIVEQDYENIEYIIIDGCSTDNSVQIIQNYHKKIAYWVSEPDKGHRYALVKGFEQATGDIVAWQNTDDYYEPRIFAKVMKIFEANPEVDVVYGNVRFVDVDSKGVGMMKFIPSCHWWLFFEKFTMHNQAAFFRRKLWDKAGGITFTDLFFDIDLIIRLNRCSNKSVFLSEILGNYRIHPGSMHFGGEFDNKRTDIWEILQRYAGFWGKMPRWLVVPPMRLFCILYRSIWHMHLGDWDYLLNGVKKRSFDIFSVTRD
jgi:glycosyltransferase involved in cell wall biosynthesis